jgi:hypothetical protein
MERMAERDPVGFLLQRKFPQHLGDSQAREAYEAELRLKSKDEQKALAIQELSAWLEEDERGRFYNQPIANADYDLWSKMSYWTVDEFTALSCGKDPNLVNWGSLEILSESSQFAWNYKTRRDLVLRAQEAGHLPTRVTPHVFLRWAADRMEIPVELQSYVSAQSALPEFLQPNESPDDPVVLKMKIAEQQQLIADLRADLNKSNMAPRERSSLVKLVATMAIKKYGYCPGKPTNAAKSIEEDTTSLGVRVGQTTILKYIREGLEDIPQDALTN